MASLTPRRSPRFQDKLSTSPTSPHKENPDISTKMTTRRSPIQPTTLEALLLVTYPLTLILGSLFSIIDPASRASPYNASSQAHVQELAPSYFAQKTNLFNLVFVKRGWFWITISYFYFLFTHPSTGPKGSSFLLTPKRIQGIVRWGLVTVWWIFVTQWFFGPAIIDRGFTLTGGQCELINDIQVGKIEMDSRQFVTSMACKAIGGKWKGGHDVSGHVFLLVLGSMFLLEEVMHVLRRSAHVKEERTILMDDGAVKSVAVEAQTDTAVVSEEAGRWTLGVKFLLGVSALSLWMLLMTAAYFHTWFEKFTGLVLALSGIFVAYFVPRIVPSVRRVVGLPGL